MYHHGSTETPSSLKTALPFSLHFHTRSFNASLFCLQQWNACSNGSWSWQSIKELQHSTETTRELLLLTSVWLSWPGGAALKEKGAQGLGSAIPGPCERLTSNSTKQWQLWLCFLWCGNETASNGFSKVIGWGWPPLKAYPCLMQGPNHKKFP